jgi:hypothetical protein
MPFNPNDHLITLQGKSYLEVRYRIQWLRDVHPDATIVTEIVDHNPVEKWCITRSTVTIPGGGSATGIARQEPTRIAADYLANCETSSVGRALGMLGFGTQFCRDFDQGEQVVDSPVSPRPATMTVTAAPSPTITSSVVYPPREEPDPELEQAKAALVAAMQREKWSLARVIETAGFVWPHITTKDDLGTLTPVQLTRLAEVITGESIINLDVHGVKRIMPAAVAIGMA